MLAAQLRKIQKQSRKVAPGMIQSPYPAARHWIGFEINPHDRDRACCLHGGSYRIGSGSDNDVAFEVHEFGCELGKTTELSLVDTGHDDCVLPVNVPGLSQRLDKHSNIPGATYLEKANPGNLPDLLRLILLRARCGAERRERYD